MNYNKDGEYNDKYHDVTITDNRTHAVIDGKDFFGEPMKILYRVEDTFKEE